MEWTEGKRRDGMKEKGEGGKGEKGERKEGLLVSHIFLDLDPPPVVLA